MQSLFWAYQRLFGLGIELLGKTPETLWGTLVIFSYATIIALGGI